MDVAYDGAGALERAGVNEYDVIVLDRDLPKVHGDDVCKQLVAQRYPARIIMLTAAAELDDRVEACPSAPTTTWPSRSRSPS